MSRVIVGSSSRNMLPRPGPVLVAVSRPLWASASDRLIARPNPNPLRGARGNLALLERLEDPGQGLRSMPAPSSATSITGAVDRQAAGLVGCGSGRRSTRRAG